jgi:hypothetical protein
MSAGIEPPSIGYELRLARTGREYVETKGRRYLIEGRLTVLHTSLMTSVRPVPVGCPTYSPPVSW